MIFAEIYYNFGFFYSVLVVLRQKKHGSRHFLIIVLVVVVFNKTPHQGKYIILTRLLLPPRLAAGSYLRRWGGKVLWTLPGERAEGE